MAKFESTIKHSPYEVSKVYAKLSDLNNLSVIREKFNDPATLEKFGGQIPADKLESIKQQLETMTFDADSISMNVAPIGNLCVRVVEREPEKCIKFQSENSPISFRLWIQVLPESAGGTKMKLTIDADVNPFIKAMVSKPLKEGIERMADVLAAIPYE